MPTSTGFAITIDPAPALEQLGRRMGGRGNPEPWRDALAQALDEAQQLTAPGIAYDSFAVVRAEEERLIIDGGWELESRVVASLFGRAPKVVLMLFTIGPALEAKVEEYNRKGDFPSGFALDIMGSIALGEVGNVGYRIIEEMASERGLKASIPLNPGTTHWPMSGQRLIAQLVPASQIGVSVTDSNILRPFKSLAFAVALGEDVVTPAEGSSCDYCENRSLCR